MPETTDGLKVLHGQMQRRSRTVAPPRRPQSQPPAAPAAGEVEVVDRPPTPAPAIAKPAPTKSAPRPQDVEERPSTTADEPVTNLAVRVRRSLDDRLTDLLYSLRRDGVRSSKVELVEMLLWELPPDASKALRKRLADFRRAAPREDPL